MTGPSGLPSRPGGTAPHVLVSDVDRPVLGESERHHLGRVRRVRSGDLVSITDGAGRWRWCTFGDHLEPVGDVAIDPRPRPTLVVAFALVKGGKPDLVVQKLTELGIDEIVPFVAERSIARTDEARSARQHDRLVAIAREAAQQSRRTWFPSVRPVAAFDEVAGIPGAVRCDRDGGAMGPEHTVVLVGPEGGWAPSEQQLPAVSLGSNVLRAETAAIAVATLQVALRDGRLR